MNTKFNMDKVHDELLSKSYVEMRDILQNYFSAYNSILMEFIEDDDERKQDFYYWMLSFIKEHVNLETLHTDGWISDDCILVEDEPVIESFCGDYDAETLEGKLIITWPMSQKLMSGDTHEIAEHCEIITDAKGIEAFGNAAFVVDSDWYTEKYYDENTQKFI